MGVIGKKWEEVGRHPETEFVTCRDLARRFGKHIKTIQGWARDGTLPAPIRLGRGGYFAWHPDTIERWLRDQEDERRTA